MALIKPTGKIAWEPSTSVDVAEYRVYYTTDGMTEATYESPFFANGLSTELVLPFPGMEPMEFANVDLGIVAVDAAGNMSDMVHVIVPIDTVPPAPVGSVVFIPAA